MISHNRQGPLGLYTFPHLAAVGAHHAIATRLGGSSRGCFASLNLSYSLGDDPALVAANRRAFYSAIGVDARSVVSCHQVHSAAVACVSEGMRGRGAIDPLSAIPSTDALITDRPDLYLFLRFADCVPVLLCDPKSGVVGLVHAGWKGTVSNIVGATVQTMVRAFASSPQDIVAAIGPCIGPCHYTIQDDVAVSVRVALPFWPDVLRRQDNGALSLDLAEANRRQLLAAGLNDAGIAMSGLCTACHTDEFYSHRAEQGRTGRFGVLIGWVGDGSGHG